MRRPPRRPGGTGRAAVVEIVSPGDESARVRAYRFFPVWSRWAHTRRRQPVRRSRRASKHR